MSAELRIDQCCIREGCKAPIRELGGLCSAHWRGLSPEERAALRWEAEALQVLVECEPVVAEEIDFDAWAAMPTFDGERRAA